MVIVLCRRSKLQISQRWWRKRPIPALTRRYELARPPPPPPTLAQISQQAAAIAKVAVKEDAVRVTKNPKRVEGVFAVQKDKSEDSSESTESDDGRDSTPGQPAGPAKKKAKSSGLAREQLVSFN